MRPIVLSFAVLFAVALAAPRATWADDDKKSDDDEKYTIKGAKFVANGKSAKINEKATITSVAKVLDDEGNAILDKKSTKTMYRVYVEKTLGVDDKDEKRTKYTRKYEKAKDVEGDEAENKPYQGKTVVFERSNGKWSLESEGLGASDLSELTEETNKETDKASEIFYPKEAVKVGGKWKMNGKEVAKFFDELKMKPESVKAEGKLVKAYKKGKQQWGTLEYLITFEADLGEIKKAKGELKVTTDQAIDASTTAGKASFTVKIAAKQTMEQNCKKFTVDVAITGDFVVETTDVK